MGAMFEIAQQRLEKFAQLLELIGVQQLAGIEHHRLELWPLAWNPRRGVQGFGAVAEYGIGEFAGKLVHEACQRSSRPGDGSPNAPTSRWPRDELTKSI